MNDDRTGDEPAGGAGPRPGSPDPARRPRRTPVRSWLVELARTSAGVVDAWLPNGRGIPARSREQMAVAVGEVHEARLTVWVHRNWSAFLGTDDDDSAELLVGYARLAAIAGAPVSSSDLRVVLSPDAVNAARATVAVVSLSAFVDRCLDDVAQQVRGVGPRRPLALLGDLVTLAAATPVVLPVATAAGAMGLANRLAPGLPVVRTPPDVEDDLVVHVLAETLPSLLRHALVRSIVLASPVPLVVGVRTEGAAATVRLGRDRITIENGLADDVLFVVEGAVEMLLGAAARALSRDLRSLEPDQR